jgi:hypothetical protein
MNRYLHFIIISLLGSPALSLHGDQEAATLLSLTEATLNQTRDNLKDLQARLPKKRQELLQRPYKQWDLWRVNSTIAEINLNKQLLTMQQYGTDFAERFNLKNRDIVVTTEKCADHDKILACLNEEALLIQERKRLIEQQSNFYNQAESELIKARSSLRPWSRIDKICSDIMVCIGVCEGLHIFPNMHQIFEKLCYRTHIMPLIGSLALSTKIVGMIAIKYREAAIARKLSQLPQEATS